MSLICPHFHRLFFFDQVRDYRQNELLLQIEQTTAFGHLLDQGGIYIPFSKSFFYAKTWPMKKSTLVNSLKGVSSRLLRNKGYPSIQQALWGKSLWSPSYFAGSCGGAPIEIIRQYIENQQSPM